MRCNEVFGACQWDARVTKRHTNRAATTNGLLLPPVGEQMRDDRDGQSKDVVCRRGSDAGAWQHPRASFASPAAIRVVLVWTYLPPMCTKSIQLYFQVIQKCAESMQTHVLYYNLHLGTGEVTCVTPPCRAQSGVAVAAFRTTPLPLSYTLLSWALG